MRLMVDFLNCKLGVKHGGSRFLFLVILGASMSMQMPGLMADVKVVVTSDNSYAFGFGDVNGINSGEYYGAMSTPGGAGDIFHCGQLALSGQHNNNGPERYDLPGVTYAGKYIYLIAWADDDMWQGTICQFYDDVTGKVVYSGRLPNVAGNADSPIQWEVFATGIENGPGPLFDIPQCSTPQHGGPIPGPDNVPMQIIPGTLAQEVERWNCHILRANNYDNLTHLNTPGHIGGSASPGWVRYDGPVLAGSLHPDDVGDGSSLAFDDHGNVGWAVGIVPNVPAGTIGYPKNACNSSTIVPPFFAPNAPLDAFGYRPSPSWMWYHPDRDLDGNPDSSNPFVASAGGVPRGEYLIFRIGPLGELFGGGDCATENATIECESGDSQADYTLTFDVINQSGYDVTQLLVPGTVNGVDVTFTNGSNSLAVNLPDGGTLAGVTLLLSGGSTGDEICIPVGLMAIDPDNGPFECCGTEVCVELPYCCLKTSQKRIAIDREGNFQLSFRVENLDGELPAVAHHLYLSPITPGITILDNHFELTPALSDGMTSGALSGSIFLGASPGQVVCFWVTIHSEGHTEGEAWECCGVECCITMPREVAVEGDLEDKEGAGGGLGEEFRLVQATSFRRSDSNGDGGIDLSDGVHLLGFLFFGEAGPACEDASDSNDDGTVDLSDAVMVFNYLYLGGIGPPSPGPRRCGADPSQEDGLGCLGYNSCD